MKYTAFLSHATENKPAAVKLKQRLEMFNCPPWKLRARRIFLDKDNLALNGIEQQLRVALDKSDYLIVLCTPVSAKKPWVDREVEIWLEKPARAGRIILATMGPLSWSDGIFKEDSVPPSLREAFREVPLYFDLSDTASYRENVARTVATLEGLEPDKLEGLLRNDLQRNRMKWEGVALILAMLVAMAHFSAEAWRRAAAQSEMKVKAEVEERLTEVARLVDNPADVYLAIGAATRAAELLATIPSGDQGLTVRVRCAQARTLQGVRLKARVECADRVVPRFSDDESSLILRNEILSQSVDLRAPGLVTHADNLTSQPPVPSNRGSHPSALQVKIDGYEVRLTGKGTTYQLSASGEIDRCLLDDNGRFAAISFSGKTRVYRLPPIVGATADFEVDQELLEISGSGRYLVTGQPGAIDGLVKLRRLSVWDLTDPLLVGRAPARDDRIALSPSGGFVAYLGTASLVVSRLDGSSRKERNGHTFQSGAFSADEHWFLGENYSGVTLFSLPNVLPVWTKEADGAAFSPNGKRLAVFQDRQLLVYSLGDTQSPELKMACQFQAHRLAWVAPEKLILCGSGAAVVDLVKQSCEAISLAPEDSIEYATLSHGTLFLGSWFRGLILCTPTHRNRLRYELASEGAGELICFATPELLVRSGPSSLELCTFEGQTRGGLLSPYSKDFVPAKQVLARPDGLYFYLNGRLVHYPQDPKVLESLVRTSQ